MSAEISRAGACCGTNRWDRPEGPIEQQTKRLSVSVSFFFFFRKQASGRSHLYESRPEQTTGTRKPSTNNSKFPERGSPCSWCRHHRPHRLPSPISSTKPTKTGQAQKENARERVVLLFCCTPKESSSSSKQSRSVPFE